MKKAFISSVTVMLLFLACSSNDTPAEPDVLGKVGGLKLETVFESVSQQTKATSKAIPVTSWDNIKQVQMFLYDKTTGNITFSYTIHPSDGNTTFPCANIPVGTYDIALVANVKSNTDNVVTTITGAPVTAANMVEFTDFNVRGKKINDQVFIDLKPTVFPANHIFQAGDQAYSEASEIFTSYAQNVTISEGVTTTLNSAMALKREVALMRVRINKNASFLNEAGKEVNFAHANNFIVIHRQPVGFGLRTQTPEFLGGIVTANSDENRVMIGGVGASTFKTADPAASAYKPTNIIDSDFRLWRDIVVLPNVVKTEPAASVSGNAENARKYFVVISATAPAGYELADGRMIDVEKPIYWSGIINEVFSPNVIREVNLTIKSRGDDKNPDGPQAEGGLIINVTAPEEWNKNIQILDKEI